MSDLSFNVIALDRASKTFLSAADSIDRMAAKLDKLDGKTATASVNIKTDESTKALDSFTNRFALMAAGIAAASPLAGAAVVAGLGAGFITVAAIAQSSNEKVQQTYKTLWSNVVQDTKQATSVLVPQLVASGNQIGHTFEALGPKMQQAFNAAGPDLVALTRGVSDFANNAMPGATAAAENSLPVFQGVATAAGTLGTAVGDAFASVGQHAAEYGTFMTSVANITSSALGLAVNLINDLAEAWSSNSSEIDAAVAGTGTVISNLAEGVLPVFSEALGIAAQLIHGVTDVLGPLAPALGIVGALALATWGAFKLSGAVTSGVKSLANSVVDMGASMEKGAAKTAVMIAAQDGVAVSASASATAVQAAGARAATASVGFGAMAESLAGPVGIALIAGVGLFALLSSQVDDTAQATGKFTNQLDGVTSALESSDGAINASVIKALEQADGFKEAADGASQFGISASQLATSVSQGGPALDKLKKQLQDVVEAHKQFATNEVTGDVEWTGALDDAGVAAEGALGKLNALVGGFQNSKDAAEQNKRALEEHANALVRTTEGQTAAQGAAQAFGLSLDVVSAGLANVASNSGNASTKIEDVLAAFSKFSLASANAEAAITNTFKQADQQVVSSRNSVAQASHGVEQASRSVADALHGEQQAARGLQQAQQGVADAQRGALTAQRAFVDAQRQEREAQVAINDARQQAIRDLKAMHQQLDDQFTSEASARVRLFDAQQAGINLGINASNALSLASTPVTAENEDRVKAAIDLLSAQNSLNAALQNGSNLRQDVAKADAAGVEGSKGVQSAQQQLASAQRQVTDASYGMEQAQRAVVRAQQSVTDASYAQQRAHQAVRDAQYQQEQASRQLTTAQRNLDEAIGNASRSLDINTDAGRRNLGQLQTLADAIRNQFGPTAAGYNTLIQQTADKFGITTGAAEALLKKLGDIPQNFKFGMTAVASANFDELNRAYNDKFGGHIGPISPNVAHAFAEGGPVPGNGGARADDQLAWVSSKEWIHPVDSVDYYGPDFMRAVQKKQFPRFASGGQVDPARINMLFSGAGVGYQSSVHALNTMGFPHPPLLPKYEPPPVVNMSFSSAGSGVRGDRAANRAIVMSTFASMFGWSSASEQAATDYLMMRESGYNNVAQNPTSTAFGMFQFLNATWGGYGIPKTSDPGLQAIAGGRYIRQRYTDPIGAAAHERAFNWYAHGGQVGANPFARIPRPRAYDNGGALPAGLSTVWNGTGKPENVRTSAQEDSLVAAVRESTRVLSAAIAAVADRPLEGLAVLDTGQVVGVVKSANRQLEFRGGSGRL